MILQLIRHHLQYGNKHVCDICLWRVRSYNYLLITVHGNYSRESCTGLRVIDSVNDCESFIYRLQTQKSVFVRMEIYIQRKSYFLEMELLSTP